MKRRLIPFKKYFFLILYLQNETKRFKFSGHIDPQKRESVNKIFGHFIGPKTKYLFK